MNVKDVRFVTARYTTIPHASWKNSLFIIWIIESSFAPHASFMGRISLILQIQIYLIYFESLYLSSFVRFAKLKTSRKLWLSPNCLAYSDGILPKGPYPPCLHMADRALLAGYHRYHSLALNKCRTLLYTALTYNSFCPRINAHGSRFVGIYCGFVLANVIRMFRVTSLELRQHCTCPIQHNNSKEYVCTIHTNLKSIAVEPSQN